MCFWNIAGLGNKKKDFWEYVTKFDVIGMVETWITEDMWEKWEEKLPQEYTWKCTGATKEKRKGRAKGGIISGVRKNLQETNVTASTEEESKKAQSRQIRIGKEIWKIVSVYNQEGTDEKIFEDIDRILGEKESGNVLIGGDWNARTGKLGSGAEEEKQRKSKDEIVNKAGKRLVEEVIAKDWTILNGYMKEDEEGSYTYIGCGTSVIDYAIANGKAIEKIKEFKVGTSTESDHMPLVIKLDIKVGRQGEEKRKKREIQDWSASGIESYKEKTERIEWTKTEPEEMIEELIGKVKEATVMKTLKLKGDSEKVESKWDRECKRVKNRIKRVIKKVKKGEGNLEELKERKREYREAQRVRKEKEKEMLEMDIKQIKNEAEVWNFLGKHRGKRKRQMSARIKIEEWKDHFQALLGGTEEEPEYVGKSTEGREEVTGESISTEELALAIQRLKKKKAQGDDGTRNENWIYGSERVKEKLLEIMQLVWEGRGLPRAWRKGVIIPLHKKGSKDSASNYRGITLLNTSYKIYATILQGKLMKQIEEKNILPETQAGFRKQRSGIDNIFILNHAIDAEISEKGGAVYCFFVDFKAAFDLINREKLWKKMEELGIDQRLIRRIKEIYEATQNVIQAGDNTSDSFWTKVGVRQGCPLSPTLFALYIADIDEILRKGQDGGLVVGNKKFHCLAYADDIVLVAKKSSELKQMMTRLEKYADKRELTVNPQKSKVMIFKRGRAKDADTQDTWSWKGEPLEVVREFKYLGYVFQRNNGKEAHIAETARKAGIAMKQAWSLGKRFFSSEFGKMEFLFTYLVESVIMYAAEIWGWQEYAKIEEIQRKFFRWSMEIHWSVPNYIILEELRRPHLSEKSAIRAAKYEGKARNGEVNLLKECFRAMDREAVSKSIWARGRAKYLQTAGIGLEYARRKFERGEALYKEVAQRREDARRQENQESIRASEKWRGYLGRITPDRPFYLRSGNAAIQSVNFHYRIYGEWSGDSPN